MHTDTAAERVELQPAYCLTYRGLSEDAERDKLSGLFAKLLRLQSDEAAAALGTPPIRLVCDVDRDKLRNHQLGLARLGCITSLDSTWKYGSWNLSESLKDSFEEAAGKLRVVALLRVTPAPGSARLLELGQALGNAAVHVLNHSDLLVEYKEGSTGGAGNWLRDLQDRSHARLRRWPEKFHLDSSLAMQPEDGDTLPELLDVLQKRLALGNRAAAATTLGDPPAWPLAGRLWQSLAQHAPKQIDSLDLDQGLQHWLRRHWPITSPETAATQNNLQQLPAWIEQYQGGAARREQLVTELRRHFAQLDKLPSLPALAMKIYKLAMDPDSSEKDLSQAVEQDPSLSSRLLAVVNSAYFGLRARIDSIPHALVILGREELAHLALLVSSEKLYSGLNRDIGHALWRHSALCAEIARTLAQQHGHDNPAALFTAALLHDVGKIFLLSFAENHMQQIDAQARRHGLPAYELERENLGHDHATLGAAMLRSWQLPEPICTSVEQHHGPLPEQAELSVDAALIGLADHIAHRLEGSAAWSDSMRLRQHQLDALKPLLGAQDYDTIELLAEDLRDKVRKLD